MSAISQSSRPSVLARVTRAIARITGPLARPLAGRRWLPLWAVVRHRGRRSGRAYAVPVAIRASDDAFTIPLPWGSETQWLRNVLVAGACTVRWRGGYHGATAPRVIGAEEAIPVFHPVQRVILRAGGVRSFLRLSRMEPGSRPA
jgi:deazaflavin-dependent oxidoreductase (nitroreductase family)